MKLILACTSGGHFSTMKELKPFWSMHERVWVTDLNEDTKSLNESELMYWLPYQPPRNLITFLQNIPTVFNILRRERPDVVISTGASIAVGFALVAKLLGMRFVFIESISRSRDLSLSGKLVYFLADEFYVQWAALSMKYPKAVFKGYAWSSGNETK